jgi:hypothetical protein
MESSPTEFSLKQMHFTYCTPQCARARASTNLPLNLFANGVWDLARWSFEVFVIGSILAWRDGREFEMPEYARREPYFETPPSPRHANRPDHDFRPDQEAQYRRLQERITQSMHQITVPLGRHATSADIRFHGKDLGTWTSRVPRWTENEISEAVRAYRSGLGAQRY